MAVRQKSNITVNGGPSVTQTGTPVLHHGGDFTHTPQYEKGTTTRGGIAHWKIFFFNYSKHASGSVSDKTKSTDDFNSAPSLSDGRTDATLDSIGMAGQPVNLFFDFLDEDILNRHTVTIDWGDGRFMTTFDVEPQESFHAPVLGYTYRDGGVYTIKVTVTDEVGGSDSLSATAIVSGVSVVEGVLNVIGTADDDTIEIDKADGQLRVRTSFANDFFLSESVTSILISAFGGDDQITIADDVNVPAASASDPQLQYRHDRFRRR